MCKVASFNNFENSLTTVKVMTKNKVAPFYLGHGVYSTNKSVDDATKQKGQTLSIQFIPDLFLSNPRTSVDL